VAEQFVRYGMDSFEVRTLSTAHAVVGEAPIANGSLAAVPCVTHAPITLTLKRGASSPVTTKIHIPHPLTAPLEKGTPVGSLTVMCPDFTDKTFPLFAGESVQKLGVFKRAWNAVTTWCSHLFA
jgi:D-alanyl-D-alanine carboxypeptidase (penicillin-binding protein 5/6)